MLVLHKEALTWSTFSPAFAWPSAILWLALGCAASEGAGPHPGGAPEHHPVAKGQVPPLAEEPIVPLELDPVALARPEHPLAALAPSALAEIVRHRTDELGSVSLGQPNRGRLVNAVAMPDGPLWYIEAPKVAWGTEETIEAIREAILRVEEEHPGSPPLHIGHISQQNGGWLRPHRSHQSGRDVDLGYYYLDGPRWYAAATADNLDRPRTWSLLMGLLTQGNVEYIFITRDVQALLLEHARSEGVDEGWLGELFDLAAPPPVPPPPPRGKKTAKGPPRRALVAPGPNTVIRHRAGHQTHLHVRFHSDQACETGRRTFELLRRYKKL